MDPKKFIAKLLKNARVKKPVINSILAEENMDMFRTAFVHHSLDPVKNNQLYKFLGENILMEFVVYYIYFRFPRINSVMWSTRLRNTIISDRVLAKTLKDDLSKLVRYGEELEEQILDKLKPESTREYLVLLSNSIEAVLACIVLVLKKQGRPHGVAIEVCRMILRSIFDDVEIGTEYQDIFDPITRLKNLYTFKDFGWDLGKSIETITTPIPKSEGSDEFNTKYTINIYGWPLNDRKMVDKNKVLLATSSGFDKKALKMEVAVMAIKKLATFKIYEHSFASYDA